MTTYQPCKRFLAGMAGLLALPWAVGCSGGSDGSMVSGTLAQDGAAVAGATVTLGDDHTTSTDDEGYFAINDAPEGTSLLRATYAASDGSALELSQMIEVSGDVDLGRLEGPAGVTLATPSEVTHQSMVLTWTRSSAADFAQYQLYRHTSDSFDSQSATQIYSTDDIDALTYTDNEVAADTEYFYRLYVATSAGWLAGSAVASEQTTRDECDIRGYGATAISPRDGDTDHLRNDPLTVEWTTRDIPDRYKQVTDMGGTPATVNTSQVNGLRDIDYYELAADTSYTAEYGWRCMAGTAGERAIPLVEFSFTTAP